MDGLQILKNHPMIGRIASYRELVISRGRTGYVALYIDALQDVALVLAIRHQSGDT